MRRATKQDGRPDGGGNARHPTTSAGAGVVDYVDDGDRIEVTND